MKADRDRDSDSDMERERTGMGELTGTILVTGGMGFIGSSFIRYLFREHPVARVVNLDKVTYAGNPRNLAEASPRNMYARHVIALHRPAAPEQPLTTNSCGNTRKIESRLRW